MKDEPKMQDSKKIVIRVSGELYKKLEKISQESGISMASVVKVILSSWSDDREQITL